jgi:hypothetical protein
MATYADPDALDVSAEHVRGGIALAKHYAGEMLRLIGAASITPDLRHAAALLRWWQVRRDPRVHLAEIYQLGPNALRSAKKARHAVGILEDHGWVRRLIGEELDGMKRREAWALVPDSIPP